MQFEWVPTIYAFKKKIRKKIKRKKKKNKTKKKQKKKKKQHKNIALASLDKSLADLCFLKCNLSIGEYVFSTSFPNYFKKSKSTVR